MGTLWTSEAGGCLLYHFLGSDKSLEGDVQKGKTQRAELRRNLKILGERLCKDHRRLAGAVAKADTFLCLESVIICFISIKCHRPLL